MIAATAGKGRAKMNAKIWNSAGEESLISANTVRGIEDIAKKSGALRVELWGEVWRLVDGEFYILTPVTEYSRSTTA